MTDEITSDKLKQISLFYKEHLTIRKTESSIKHSSEYYRFNLYNEQVRNIVIGKKTDENYNVLTVVYVVLSK